MPPLIVPPLVKWSLAALGGAAIVRWVVGEMHRVNAELARVNAASTIDPVTRERLPKLRRDPKTGDYRVM
jgi:hypothetical protein